MILKVSIPLKVAQHLRINKGDKLEWKLIHEDIAIVRRIRNA